MTVFGHTLDRWGEIVWTLLGDAIWISCLGYLAVEILRGKR